MLTLDNISFWYKDKIIFNKIEFCIIPGSIFLIKGPNGSGKTTLLKIIAGLLTPTTGSVKWNNINIHDDKNTYQKYCASYLGIKNALKTDLSIIENLYFWASLKNHYELVLPAMGQFKLTEIADVECYKLSSGWQKRVALARLIIANTTLWLIDEPDVHLDDEAKDMLQKLITIKAREGGMVIIASHNMYNFPQTSIINMEDFKPKVVSS